MTEATIKDLKDIIKACQKAKVTHLKFRNIEIDFKKDQDEEVALASRPTLKVPSKKIEERQLHLNIQEQALEADDALSTLHVEDPSAFEAAMIERGLGRDADKNVGDDEEAQIIGASSAL